MRERSAQILKIICLGLAVWLAWELVQAGKHANPLANVAIPDVPSLPADTNAPPAVANKPSAKPGTNVVTSAATTNGPAIAGDTNAAPHKRAHPGGTNAVAVVTESASTNIAAVTNMAAATNLVMNPPTNASVTIVAETNEVVVAKTNESKSDSALVVTMTSPTNASGSNVSIALPTNAVVSDTNLALTKMSGTNLAGDTPRTNLTNAAMAKAHGARPPNAMMAAMMGGPGGKAPAKLAPEIQARVDRVYESEIFAPVMHPMPMALMGIAGKVAFLRAPNGQTGLVKEGEDLGDIKLLRIGTNRVLVEQDGKSQELMIFSGFAGESLLSKTNDSSHETTKH